MNKGEKGRGNEEARPWEACLLSCVNNGWDSRTCVTLWRVVIHLFSVFVLRSLWITSRVRCECVNGLKKGLFLCMSSCVCVSVL